LRKPDLIIETYELWIILLFRHIKKNIFDLWFHQ
jgi:hypothetical protein